MTSPYQTEREMYEPVRQWLHRFMAERFKRAQVQVFDASSMKLSRLIDTHSLDATLPPEWPTWDIQVDIVGFAHFHDSAHLAFVECKNVALSLDHLAQLLGYARVARPLLAFLIAPQGLKSSLKQLLITHQRLDVLEYTQEQDGLPRSLVLARWDVNMGAIAMDSVVTTGIQRVALGKYL